jgi:L-ascorbate metabolism protein UlaG (beta-lactamase superfamily)
METLLAVAFLVLLCSLPADARDPFEKDVIRTSSGNLEITFIGHGSLMFSFGGRIVHVDPYSRLADYTVLPKADLVLLTHGHGDHLDPVALEKARFEKTMVVLTEACAKRVQGGVVMKNGEARTVMGIGIEAVPAYNLVHRRDDGQVYHPRGEGNGYVLTFGDRRVYVAGDTENTPEMKALKRVDCAFLPMNLPYTMTPEMVADAARAFRPKILYPYHYGETDPSRVLALLRDAPDIDVRIRRMK